jgi:hypothetical protein
MLLSVFVLYDGGGLRWIQLLMGMGWLACAIHRLVEQKLGPQLKRAATRLCRHRNGKLPRAADHPGRPTRPVHRSPPRTTRVVVGPGPRCFVTSHRLTAGSGFPPIQSFRSHGAAQAARPGSSSVSGIARAPRVGMRATTAPVSKMEFSISVPLCQDRHRHGADGVLAEQGAASPELCPRRLLRQGFVRRALATSRVFRLRYVTATAGTELAREHPYQL